MAIFHFNREFISRGKGQSVVAAAAYQSRSKLNNERDGLVKDYTGHGQQDVLFSGLYTPKGAPEWMSDREKLWNGVEKAEDVHNKTRAKAAQLAQHIKIALAHELDLEQNRRALQDFVRETFVRKGFVCDLNIHAPDRDGDSRNIHAHLLVTLRKVEGEGFSAVKERHNRAELKEQVNHWREAWAKTLSRHLERAGFKMESARMVYAHKTLEEQQKIAVAQGDKEHAEALNREAMRHEGPTATQMKREGQGTESWRVRFNEDIAARNDERKQLRSELNRLWELETWVYYADTPGGRLSRLDRIHEWQADRLVRQQARERLKLEDAHAWQRLENLQQSPVVAAWRERERARQQSEMETAQGEVRQQLTERQQQTRELYSAHLVQGDYQHGINQRLDAQHRRRMEGARFKRGFRTRLREEVESYTAEQQGREAEEKLRAKREQEAAQKRYYDAVKEGQRDVPLEERERAERLREQKSLHARQAEERAQKAREKKPVQTIADAVMAAKQAQRRKRGMRMQVDDGDE